MNQKILVVGAGPSGLVALKELIEHGIDACAVEVESRIGGVFDRARAAGRVYDSTLLTVSNAFMAYSSFPPPENEERRYWNHREYHAYLTRFAEHFDLMRHIRFGVALETAHVQEDRVRAVLTDGEHQWTEDYDALALCTGTHRVPKYPGISGLETFTGRVDHSYVYENAEPYRGKRVVCIGMGETGADVAHEVALVADKALLSLRHYPSIIPRFPFEREHTNDAYTSRMLYSPTVPVLQLRALKQLTTTDLSNASGAQQALFDWMIRSGGGFGQWFTKNEIFLADIASGALELNVDGIERIAGETVYFRDGSSFDADVILCSTGYRDEFPISDVSIGGVRNLFKHAFHPELRERVAFIGWARPEVGGIPTCSELQARYFAQLVTGQRQLPSSAEMRAVIASDRRAEEAYFRNTPLPESVVHYSSYCDDLARLIGCHPLEDAWVTDPRLRLKLWAGSQVAAQYRLTGPGADPRQARETIDRWEIVYPGADIVRTSLLSTVCSVPLLSGLIDRWASHRSRQILERYVAERGGVAVPPDGGAVIRRP